MILQLFKTLKTEAESKDTERIQINSITELFDTINEKETLSKYLDKKQSVNGFACRKLELWENIPLEFSWIDIDGKGHLGVTKDEINRACGVVKGLKIPFLVFKTQHENCYKIICHVSYLSGKELDYDEYKQINEKFQKYIFKLAKLKDYEEGSCSPTKGFCLSKNGIKLLNATEQPFNITFAYERPQMALAATNQPTSDIQKSEKEKFEFALKYVTTDICSTFEAWTSCAMALNLTFGDGGLEYFRTISSYFSGKQTPAEVDAKYKHCKNATRVSIGTVYKLIENAGIRIDWAAFYERDKPTAKIVKKDKPKARETAKKFTDVENAYYFQLHGFFSTHEISELLELHGFDLDKFKLSYDKQSLVLINWNGKDTTLNQVFAEKFEEFTKICTVKHFALYTDVLEDKFSFNFTTEELTSWICGYPQTIFRNYQYNRALHAIMPTVQNSERFNIARTVKAKIENLFNSELNVQDKKFKEFNQKITDASIIFSEEFEARPLVSTISQNNGWIDEVLKTGRKYINEHPKADNDGYWFESLSSIFSITAEDFFSLVSFTVDSIRVRLYGDRRHMRAIIVTGDSGIGKDSFLQGCFTGLNFQKAEDVILRGSIYGATNFSAAKIEKFKAIMYNYISDDLASANASTNLDTITSASIGVENKGKDKQNIQKRFNTIITNNDPRVIFGKDKDPNAIARRMNFASIKYAKGCASPEYRTFYSHYDGQFDGYWAGFFTFCFELEKFNNEVIMLSDRSREYTLNNLHKLFYQGNDDSRILDMLTEIYNNRLKVTNSETDNEFIRDIKGRVWLIIKSISDYWKKDSKFSGDTIKRVVKAHILDARMDTTYRNDHGVVTKVALMIPCQYFSQAPDDEVFTGEKTNLIENFKKYI